MTTAALIVAAGRGSRAGGDMPKQWRQIAGKTVVDWTLDAFLTHQAIDLVVLAIHPDDVDLAPAASDRLILTHGGATRDETVRLGMDAIAGNAISKILIHDVARPCVSAQVITDVVDALDHHPGAAPGVPVVDALWCGENGQVSGTQDRTGLFRAQTPQGFRFAPLMRAHHMHPGGAADDVEVARAAGLAVHIVPGDEDNFKITHPADFARAEKLLGE